VLEATESQAGTRVRASTSLERALTDAQRLHAQLRCIEFDYAATLGAAKECLAASGRASNKDPRAYWFAGKYMADFLRRIEAKGFYLADKNHTLAAHVGISRASVEKILSFHSRYQDPTGIDVSIPWSVYRDNKEKTGSGP
jgi:hypothetical protein